MSLTLSTVSCYCIAVTIMLQLLMLLFTEGCASNPCHDNCRCEDTEHTFRCVCPEQHGVHGLITHTPSKSSLSQLAFIAGGTVATGSTLLRDMKNGAAPAKFNLG